MEGAEWPKSKPLRGSKVANYSIKYVLGLRSCSLLRRPLHATITINIITIILCRTVEAACPKEITRAATLWMGTSFARPATRPGFKLSRPRLAPTSECSGRATQPFLFIPLEGLGGQARTLGGGFSLSPGPLGVTSSNARLWRLPTLPECPGID